MEFHFDFDPILSIRLTPQHRLPDSRRVTYLIWAFHSVRLPRYLDLACVRRSGWLECNG